MLAQHRSSRLIAYLATPDRSSEDRLVAFGRALADPKRVEILALVGRGVGRAADLVDATGLTRSTVHHHLAQLRDAGLVALEGNARAYTYVPRTSGRRRGGRARRGHHRNGGRVMRYTLLGRSGLRVSEVALGTMTFGEAWGWGASEDESRRMFEAFVEAGGNFVDTACNYTDGQSESIVGALVEPARDRFVVATKYTLTARRDDPNAGGNHRKNLVQTLEASLRRLRTDYVDLLWLHMWDGMTPVDEVVRALDDLVSSGKVLYVGISDTPAWVVSQAVTLAELRGWSPFVAVQAPYSLADRDVERELLPMAQALGLDLHPVGDARGRRTHREVPRRERRAATLRRRRPEGERAGTRGDRRRGGAGSDARAGRDRVGARAAVAHDSDRRRPNASRSSARTSAHSRSSSTREQLERLAAASEFRVGFPRDFLESEHVRGLIFGDTFELIDDPRSSAPRQRAAVNA